MPSRSLVLLTCFAVGQLACESSSTNNDGGVSLDALSGLDAGGAGGSGLDAAAGDTGTAGDSGLAGADGAAGDGGASDVAVTEGGGGDGTSGDGTAAAGTFTQVYAIISSRCSPCHTTAAGIGVMQGHLDMTSQAAAFMNLVNTPAAGVACTGKGMRVTPGMPDSSVMYLKISLDDAAPCGSKMPLGRAPLPQAEADTIESWIMAGAMNN
jgi:hypothetical protein